MKRNTTVARVTQTDAGPERIRKELGLAAINSRQHRTLSTLIRIEASTYRKALDTEQATATHDNARVQPTVRRGSLKRTSASQKPIAVPHRKRSGSRSDPLR